MTVHWKGDGKLCAKLRFYSQQLQHAGVGGSLVGSLLRQSAFDGVAVHPVCLRSVRVTDLHMGFVEGDVVGHSDKAAQSPFLNERVGLDLVKLLLGQIFKAAVVPAAALAKLDC